VRKEREVTAEVERGEVDGDALSLLRCVCGQEFEPWDFVITDWDKRKCPQCGRGFRFEMEVAVYEVYE